MHFQFHDKDIRVKHYFVYEDNVLPHLVMDILNLRYVLL